MERIKKEFFKELDAYVYRMDVFETSVNTVMTKFKRL